MSTLFSLLLVARLLATSAVAQELCAAGFSAMSPYSPQSVASAIRTYKDLLVQGRLRIAALKEVVATGDPFTVSEGGDDSHMVLRKRLREFSELIDETGWPRDEVKAALLQAAQEQIAALEQSLEQTEKAVKRNASDQVFDIPGTKAASVARDGRFVVAVQSHDGVHQLRVCDAQNGRAGVANAPVNKKTGQPVFNSDGTRLIIPRDHVLAVHPFSNGQVGTQLRSLGEYRDVGPDGLAVGNFQKLRRSKDAIDRFDKLAATANPRFLLAEYDRFTGVYLFDLAEGTSRRLHDIVLASKSDPEPDAKSAWTVVEGTDRIVATRTYGSLRVDTGVLDHEGKITNWKKIGQRDLRQDRLPRSTEAEHALAAGRQYVAVFNNLPDPRTLTLFPLGRGKSRDVKHPALEGIASMDGVQLSFHPSGNELMIVHPVSSGAQRRVHWIDVATGTYEGSSLLGNLDLSFTSDGQSLVGVGEAGIRVMSYEALRGAAGDSKTSGAP